MLDKTPLLKLLSASLLTLASEPLLAYDPRSLNLPSWMEEAIIVIGFFVLLFWLLLKRRIFGALGFSSPLIAFLLFPGSDLAILSAAFFFITAPVGAWIGGVFDEFLGIASKID